MSIIFVLIPILAAIAILCGCKARLTALIASGLTLILGLGSVFCWKAEVWSVTLQVLSKPSIHLAMGFYDGMSLIGSAQRLGSLHRGLCRQSPGGT